MSEEINRKRTTRKRKDDGTLVAVPLAAIVTVLEYSLPFEFKHFCETFEADYPSGNDTYRDWLVALERFPKHREHILHELLEIAARLERQGIKIKTKF